MFLLLMLAGVDFLLPAVQVPLFAWLLLGMLWLSSKVVSEARRESKPTRPQIVRVAAKKAKVVPELDWIADNEDFSSYSLPGDSWVLVDEGEEFLLYGRSKQLISLSATTIGPAMSQAEAVIYALSVAD